MNLFYNPTLTDLSMLIACYANYHDHYDIIVDHDGEVFIKPSAEAGTRNLSRFKFYFEKLHGKAYIGILAAKNLRYLNQLYKNLLYCWSNDLKGSIDYEEISSLQTLNNWLTSNHILTDRAIARPVA
jgi:hypothetical protein